MKNACRIWDTCEERERQFAWLKGKRIPPGSRSLFYCFSDEPTTLAEIVKLSELRVQYTLAYLEDQGMIEHNPSEVSYQMTQRTDTW